MIASFANRKFANLEMPVKAVAVNILDIWAGRRRFDRHFPFGVRQIKAVIDVRVGKRLALGKGRETVKNNATRIENMSKNLLIFISLSVIADRTF